MTDIHLQYHDEVNVKILADPGVLMELAEAFSYHTQNYKWDRRYKAGFWDGKVSLVNRLTGLCYAGLASQIKKFAERNEYSFSFDDELVYDKVTKEDVLKHVEGLGLPDWLEIRDYQLEAVMKCAQSRRRTLLSPTSSGKSLIIYLLHTWYQQKSLIIVPSVGLVQQFKDDIESYGFKGKIAVSSDGFNKQGIVDCDIFITTWQSLDNGTHKVPAKWYKQFDVAFGDEAHGAKAASMIRILKCMTTVRYRFGTTGTLDDNTLNKLTIQGLFGPIFKTTTTRELIDQGYATNIKIKAIVLEYPDHIRKEFHKKKYNPQSDKLEKKTYAEEIDFICEYEARIKYIKKMAQSLEGNKLIFFRIIKHGESIYNSFDNKDNIFYIDGGVKDRNAIRVAIEDEENATLIASLGTTSTGVSIKRLHHMISAAPMKAKIKLLQSIGRMLRQHDQKEEAIMYDIVDDLSWGKQKNFALKHFEERAKIYDQEQFEYVIYRVKLK